jgi:CRISPR/Cas system CSM-associated protein Csm2 small subunit
LNTTDVENIAVEWAQSQSDKESCICFAPVKCESYHLYEENSRDSKATAFRKIFDDMFSGIENTVHKVNPSVRMFYVPVETVGCIKNVTHDWHVGEALEFHADYTITGIRREIKGADRLLSKVYEYAYEQITDENAKTEKMIEIQEGKASIFQKSKIVKERKFFEKCKSLLEPIILVFGKYSEDVANNNRPEEIVV